MERNEVTVSRLPSGLIAVCKQQKGVRVEYCGAVVKVGSRDDGIDHPGLAHFVEHTIFKGTASRSSWHIINRMERVGGELNAYTSKEETVVYAAAPAGNASRAFDLIADLVVNSRFPSQELDKEREVVSDEVNSYLDTPSEAVYDDFDELIFAGTPLAHNILGNVEALSTFDSELCRAYLHRWYTADNMVVFYCGALSSDRAVALIEKHFASLPCHATGVRASIGAWDNDAFMVERSIDSHQAHTVMGCRIGDVYDPSRFSMALLTNILGGPGMNSRLNVALREKRGYVYSVEASTTHYSDCGLFNIYFGCDPEDTSRCQDLIDKIIRQMASQPLSPTQLAMAKKQYLGQLAVASDNRENSAIAAARVCLYYPRPLSPQEVINKISEITSVQICEAAQSITNLSSLTLI